MSELKDYWRIVKPAPVKTEYVSDSSNAISNFTTLSQILKGAGDRLSRYKTYETMDTDTDVSRALDTVAEEMSTFDDVTDLPFILKFANDIDKEVEEQIVITLDAALNNWCVRQRFDHGKVFSIARMVIKYGDCFFRKFSDFKPYQFINPSDILGIEIDDEMNIVNYHIRSKSGKRYSNAMAEVEIVPAAGVVHFSLTDMMGDLAPFGGSILDGVVKTYRQLKMLEDASVIYRIARAPERRVFYVDTGNMPAHKVKTYLEQIKNEMRQRKIPNNANGKNDVDVAFNPENLLEDFFLAQPANGRGSRVETLAGGAQLGEIADLQFFREKLYRGLRIPYSYMNSREAGGSDFNDGKVGTAYIEELRFSNYVKRLQNKLEPTFDQEFKKFLKTAGIRIDPNLFYITLPDPQNFAAYRQAAIDAELFNVFSQAKDIEFLSKRFIMRRFLRLTEAEIQENEILLKQEVGVDEGASISDIQQIYDPKYTESREPPTLEVEEPEAPEEPEPEAEESEPPEEPNKTDQEEVIEEPEKSEGDAHTDTLKDLLK